MPTPDDHPEPTPRAARRALGRGPGTSPAAGVGDPGAAREAGPEAGVVREGAEPEAVREPAVERDSVRAAEPDPEPEPDAEFVREPVPDTDAVREPEVEPEPEPVHEREPVWDPVPEPESASHEPVSDEPVSDGPVSDGPGPDDQTPDDQAPERPASHEPAGGGPANGESSPQDGPGNDGGGARDGENDGHDSAQSRGDGQDGAQDDDEEKPDDGRFKVVLDNFEGPFDLLLQLISKHKLDVTEVALSKVTDEFMAYIHAMGPDYDLDQTTEFLVVAATLLDLKAARLLPAAEVEDEEDLALLEARDLLFARLLQYRAYKEIAGIFADRMAQEAHRHPRTVGLEPHHAELLPEVAISIGPEGFARLAVKAMRPKPKPQVYVEHIHAPLVSVREQAEVVVARLRELGEATFQQLTQDAPDVLTVVARFLALLELFRERAVDLEQEEALGSLTVRWSGEDGKEPLVTDEFDQEPGPEGEESGEESPRSEEGPHDGERETEREEPREEFREEPRQESAPEEELKA